MPAGHYGDTTSCNIDGVAYAGAMEHEVATMRIPHELQEEFPDEAALITRLIKTNYLFRRWTNRYDEVNRQI